MAIFSFFFFPSCVCSSSLIISSYFCFSHCGLMTFFCSMPGFLYLNISFRVDLVLLNSFSLCLSEKFFISPSILSVNIAG